MADDLAISTPAEQPQRLRRLLPKRAVLDVIGSSGGTLYRWIEQDGFPLPIKAYGQANRWFEDEVAAWLASRPRAKIKTRSSEPVAA